MPHVKKWAVLIIKYILQHLLSLIQNIFLFLFFLRIFFYWALTHVASWLLAGPGQVSTREESPTGPVLLERLAEPSASHLPPFPQCRAAPNYISQNAPKWRLEFAWKEFGGNLQGRRERDSVILQGWWQPEVRVAQAAQRALRSPGFRLRPSAPTRAFAAAAPAPLPPCSSNNRVSSYRCIRP